MSMNRNIWRTAIAERDYEEIGTLIAKPDLYEAEEDAAFILKRAIAAGSLKIVQMLVESGLPVNARDPRGLSALDYAEQFGRPDIAEYLELI